MPQYQEGGILSGPEITKQLEKGSIQITPFDPKYINPASVDLTLGTQVSLYRGTYISQYDGGIDGTTIYSKKDQPLFDSKSEWATETFDIGPKGWVLKPGLCYLMHTAERVYADGFVPVLDGKSSIGRMFIHTHITAGYGDSGFDGQYTLEVITQIPVRVYAGMRFCQIRFHTIQGASQNYDGRYKGNLASGAIGSRAWEQIEEN